MMAAGEGGAFPFLQAAHNFVVPMTSKINKDRRTTVPKELREALKLKPGDKLFWEISGPSVFVSVTRRPRGRRRRGM